MGSVNPPDGVELVSGVWGTDIDRNESVWVTGGSSVEFKSGHGAEIATAWMALDSVNTARYNLNCVVRASRISGGDLVTVQFVSYAADRHTVVHTESIWSGPLASANQWLMVSSYIINTPAAAAWGRFIIEKANTAFSLYLEYVDATRDTPGLEAWQATATSSAIAASTWTTVPYDGDTVKPANGLLWLGSASGLWTRYRGDTMLVHARVTLDGLVAGNTVKLRFYDVGNSIQDDVGIQQVVGANGTHSFTLVALSDGIGPFGVSNAVGVQVWHNGGAGVHFIGATAYEDSPTKLQIKGIGG